MMEWQPGRAPTTPAAGRDHGAVPVLGVILMVATAVTIATTVAIFFGAILHDQAPPEAAGVRASLHDADRDGAPDIIRVLLVQASRAPYTYDHQIQEVRINVQSPSGNASIGAHGATWSVVCTQLPSAAMGTDMCGPGNVHAFGAIAGVDRADTAWNAGQSLFVACRGPGVHGVQVILRGTVVADVSVTCGEATGT